MITGTSNDICKSPRLDSPIKLLSSLPIELLSSIANCLNLIELLSFRGCCKDFRGSSSIATAQIESTQEPWLFCYRQESSQCLLYNQSESKKYKCDIPELQGATCLASYQGWLLLFKNGSIYFFCPFSLAKIPLPDFTSSEVSNHVGSFSSLPMNPDCVVSVINRLDVFNLEVNVICRGEKEWTQHRFRDIRLQSITSATFASTEGVFYYLEKAGKLTATFSVVDKKLRLHNIVIASKENTELDRLPFLSHSGSEDVKIDDLREWFDVEKDEPLTIFGTTFQRDTASSPTVIENESIGVPGESKTREARVIWIQPRFYDANSHHSWFT